MQVAFHFDEDALGGGQNGIIPALMAAGSSRAYVKSKVFIGTVLFDHAAMEFKHEGDSATGTIDRELLKQVINGWFLPHSLRWRMLKREALDVARAGRIFAVCFESIDPSTAETISKKLESRLADQYLGALEVDESLPIHINIYRLVPFCRIRGTAAWAFWDGVEEDSKMHYELDWLKDAGFMSPKFESIGARFTILDANSNAAPMQRVAQSRNWIRELMDSISDSVLCEMSDAAPDIPEKLWHALSSLRNATTGEEASSVALSCRRIFESVADSIFPPVEDPKDDDEKRLGTTKYKNRVLKYLEQNNVEGSERSLITATMDVVAKEVDALNDAANKGLHTISSETKLGELC